MWQRSLFFLLSCPKGTRNVFEIKNGSEKEGVTVMACFGANGDVIEPQVVLGYKRVPFAVKSAFPPSLQTKVQDPEIKIIYECSDACSCGPWIVTIGLPNKILNFCVIFLSHLQATW